MASNIQDVETSIKDQLNSLLQSPSNPCIRKVPEYMSTGKMRGCFEPLVVSIGPLYYDKEALKPFNELKLRHLQSLLDHPGNNINLGKCIDIIKEREDEIRSYYLEKSSLSGNKFIEMILIDAAFIITLFMRISSNFGTLMNPIRYRPEELYPMTQDLFLVENQIPYFVLCDLFDKAFGVAYPNVTFTDVTCRFISNLSLPGSEVAYTIAVREKLRDASNVKHLVDCLRICNLPTKLGRNQLPSNKRNIDNLSKTAKELKAFGVKFIASETSKSLLDITFSKGVLRIPLLQVEDSTKAILRNIAFFEECNHYSDSYVIDYLFFMDALIDSPEDVQILVQNGIIKTWLGSDEEVATLFNQVTKDLLIYCPGFYYAHLCQELNAYANTNWNRWKALLRRDYFNHPWSVISLVYLALLLILTVLQVYTGFKA